MEQKNSQTHSFQIKNFKDVFDYCYLNGITDVTGFVEKCFKSGFDIEKYGLIGEQPKVVEKEIIKEIKVEIPVEKIVEVIKYVDREIIKEVPVEKLVEKIIEKEVPVEKVITVTETKEIVTTKDDEKVKMLQGTLQSLKKQLSLRDERIKELDNKIKELENLKINQGAVFLKNSNLSKNL